MQKSLQTSNSQFFCIFAQNVVFIEKPLQKLASSSVRVERLKLFELLAHENCVPLSCYQSSYWIVTDCDFVGTLPRVVMWRVVPQRIPCACVAFSFLFRTASFEFRTYRNETKTCIGQTTANKRISFPLNILLCLHVCVCVWVDTRIWTACIYVLKMHRTVLLEFVRVLCLFVFQFVDCIRICFYTMYTIQCVDVDV